MPLKCYISIFLLRCDRIMMEFLGEIKANVEEDSSLGVTKTEIAFSEMVNVLIMHAQFHHVTLQVQ